MPSQNPNVMATSKDAAELMRTAAAFAGSAKESDHSALRQHLGSEEFLNRLDSAEDYSQPPKRLRLARVLRTLAENPASAAASTLLVLARSPVFTAVEQRQYLLILALVPLRPAPADAVRFWRLHSAPETVWRHVTVAALCDNGSEPALALLEEVLVHPQHDPEEKVVWMRDPLLRHRNEVPLLSCCERMITRSLPEEQRPDLLEALCDYRPNLWYVVCTPPVPPARAAASREAREILRRICQWGSANLKLRPSVKLAVESTLKEIGGAERS
jgi:hypothetical protein